MDTLHVHLFEPFYSKQSEKQAMARAIRRCSHKRLPLKKRVVKIHKYYNIKEKNAFYKIFDQEDTMTDNTIEKYSSVKQILLQQIINNSIKSAIDAKLRNF